jgi:hypothetical protein
MRSHPIMRHPWVIGALCVAALAGSICRAHAAAAFTLVVHKDNPQKEVTSAELKNLLSGATKQWSGGAVVHVGLIMADSPETQYLASLVGSSATDLLGRIQQQVFKGEMRRPAALKSSADCLAFAKGAPGALCVASAATPLPPDVHALAVK